MHRAFCPCTIPSPIVRHPDPFRLQPFLPVVAGSIQIFAVALAFAALTTPSVFAQAAAAESAQTEDKPVTLSPFEVRTDKDYGYRKQSTVTTSRIGVDITTILQAIKIISSELLNDFALDDAVPVFRYTSSVLAGEREILQTTTSIMRGFGTQSYYNGLRMARSETAPFFPTDNLDGIEITKGPVELFYGNWLPNGIVNYITKKPNFTNTTSVTLSDGSYAFQKAVLDTQRVVDKWQGLAYRLITSSQRNEARIDNLIKDYVLLSPSIVFQPWRPVQISAEMKRQKSHNPYPDNANVRQFIFNPQYAEDVANPSRQILDYMRRRFNLADDTAANAMVVTRWAPVNHTPGLTSRNITTWQAGMFDLTGVHPFVRSGDKIGWWWFSPRGHKFATQAPQSNFNGNIRTKNATLLHHWQGRGISPEAATLLADMNRPIDPVRENIFYDDRRQYRGMGGGICLACGSGVALFSMLPTQLSGRLSFLVCGAFILCIGGLLWRLSRREPAPTS